MWTSRDFDLLSVVKFSVTSWRIEILGFPILYLVDSPVADVATSVFMSRASSTAAYPVHVLVTLAAVLGEVNSSAEHAADVSVPFVEAFLNDRVDERTAVEQHSFVCLRQGRPGSGPGARTRG